MVFAPSLCDPHGGGEGSKAEALRLAVTPLTRERSEWIGQGVDRRLDSATPIRCVVT
jgi:hypothetical protein